MKQLFVGVLHQMFCDSLLHMLLRSQQHLGIVKISRRVFQIQRKSIIHIHFNDYHHNHQQQQPLLITQSIYLFSTFQSVSLEIVFKLKSTLANCCDLPTMRACQIKKRKSFVLGIKKRVDEEEILCFFLHDEKYANELKAKQNKK